MILPTPLPDEFCKGILGRMRILNVFSSSKELLDWLRKSNQTEMDKTLPAISLLANTMGIDVHDFVTRHSLLPLFKAVNDESGTIIHRHQYLRIVLRHSGFKSSKKGAHLCPECIEEDDNFWGYSFWRRTHQISSIPWCQKHGVMLRKVELPNAFDFIPGNLLDASSETGCSNALIGNPTLRRYAIIMQDLLYRDRPIPVRHIFSHFNRRCDELNLRIYKGGTGRILSDLALESLPPEWLRDHFPKIPGKLPGDFITSLDAVNLIHIHHTAEPYALAAALLWDSPDEAMLTLSAPPEKEINSSRKLLTYANLHCKANLSFQFMLNVKDISEKPMENRS